MADDNPEDDLFADLYDADETEEASVPTVASTAQPAEPVAQPAAADAQSGSDPHISDEVPTVVVNNNVNSHAESYGEPQVVVSENNGQAQSGFEDQEDSYGPVGIKEDGKMFIGGLNWETTDESLKNYFSEFGEVLECTVMRDSATGRSRGFGFLTFKDPKTVNTVMVKEHFLDGKIIDPKRAIPREEQERTSKIFVGGVSQEATERDFKEFFMNFGRVVDATLMMDKDTGRPRGFGFVTFDGDEAVDRTLAGPLEIHGKPIEVKRAQPRGNMNEDDRGGRFNRGNKFGNRPQDGGNQQMNQGFGSGDQQQNQGPPTMQQGMSPAMMAQYWTRMQQYFSMMQQQMAQSQMNPMAMMGGQMNPAQMQQMQQMMAMQQQAQAQQGVSPGGTPNPQSPGPNQQAMVQQMQNQMGSGGQQGFMNDQGAASASNKAGFSAHEQLAFEQQKYERQQQQRMQQNQQYSQQYGGGSNQSWDGMYDDVPQPNQGGQQGGFQGGRGGKWQNRGGRGGNQQSQTPPIQPNNAPANAPTGPKNAGRPGANYRGGGRGGGRGWRPY